MYEIRKLRTMPYAQAHIAKRGYEEDKKYNMINEQYVEIGS